MRVWDPTHDNMNNNDTESSELSSHEGSRCQFNGGTGAIKLGIEGAGSVLKGRASRDEPEKGDKQT